MIVMGAEKNGKIKSRGKSGRPPVIFNKIIEIISVNPGISMTDLMKLFTDTGRGRQQFKNIIRKIIESSCVIYDAESSTFRSVQLSIEYEVENLPMLDRSCDMIVRKITTGNEIVYISEIFKYMFSEIILNRGIRNQIVRWFISYREFNGCSYGFFNLLMDKILGNPIKNEFVKIFDGKLNLIVLKLRSRKKLMLLLESLISSGININDDYCDDHFEIPKMIFEGAK